MEWQEVPETIDAWMPQALEVSQRIKRAAVDTFTSVDAGYYWHPVREQVAAFHAGTVADGAFCKAALVRALGRDAVRASPFLSTQELSEPDSAWVKVAYSQSLHKALQYLNFFPGQYPGGIPNHPSPLTAMLTSGAVGAGLGWGVGHLAGKAIPGGYGDNLGRTGAIIGGALGAAPGGAWAAANADNDKSLLDGWPFNSTEDKAVDPWGEVLKKGAEQWADIPLGALYVDASEKLASAFADFAPRGRATPADVNINALGQTLWDAGAGQQLTAAALGAMYAAQRLPDPYADPEIVTGNQLAQLTANTVGNYATGYLAGVVLNKAIGSAFSPGAIGAGNAALGLISAVVPKLFGR